MFKNDRGEIAGRLLVKLLLERDIMKHLMRDIAGLLLLACTGFFQAAAATDFPDKPVTIMVPYAAGGSSDAIARIVAKELSKKWNQAVLVDNRAGGQTVIATSAVAKARSDGHTLLYTPFSWITNQFLMKDLPYKSSELAPVTLLGRYPLALMVRADLPVNTLGELLDYAKKANRPLTFGIAAIGSSMHLATLEFANQTGIEIISVPYKGGSIAALNDLMGGQIDAIFEGAVYKPHIDGRRVKALFLGQSERMSGWALPSAPEVGLPKFGMAAWFGLMAPGETPAAIREKIAADVTEVLRQADVRERLAALGLITDGMSPAQFFAFLEGERSKLGVFVERNRAQLQ